MIVETVVKDGRIECSVENAIPDGTVVVVNIYPQEERIGIDESELDDSPEGIEKWIAWVESTNNGEVVEFREPDEFDERFRQYNLEAVRKQMEMLGGSQ